MSRTSSSWVRSCWPHSATSLRLDSAAVACPSGLYQTGMRCPHQSWREMHQSRMFSIQLRYERSKRSGRSGCGLFHDFDARPRRAFIWTNHCQT